MYADFEYYTDIYKNGIDTEDLDKREIEKLLREASFELDELCYGRIRGRGFENLTEYQQELIKQANCIQADFKAKYGQYTDIPLGGYSIGDVSLGLKEDNKTDSGLYIDKKVNSLLNRTGLTVRRL